MTDFYSWVGGLSAEAIVAILSAAFAGLSYLFNLRLVRRQSRMQAANLKLAHDTDIIAWFHETVETLADAQEVLREAGRAYDVTEAWAKRSHTRTRISALMDRGRLFFPNDLDREDQDDREEGYKGRTQPALRALFKSYRIVSDWTPPESPEAVNHAERKALVKRLVDQRRIFVSEVYKVVDPKRRGSIVTELGE